MPGILPMKMIRVGSSTQSRIAQACDRCRSKKIRCDGVRPTCSQCANVGFECKTSDKLSRRAFPRGYTESLEDRVRGLEAEVRELKQLLDEKDEKIDMLSRLHSFSPMRKSSASLSPANSAQIKAEVRSAQEEILHVEIPAPVHPKASSGCTSTTSALIESFENKVQEQERPCPPICSATLLTPASMAARSSGTPNNSSSIPPRLLSDQYINLFFQEWQPLLPVLHRQTFLRLYEQFLADPDAQALQANKLAVAQLFLIFEIAAHSSSSKARPNTAGYEQHWRKALSSASSAPSLTALQCHVLAQLCYLLKADHSHLLRHRAYAVNICQQLGLHQSHRSHLLSTFEAESRKKVFWCQYALDKFASASTGMPMLLRDCDISTEYPADVDDENINEQGFSPALPGELTKVSSALALFRMSRILAKTLEHLYPAAASYTVSLKKLHSLSDELDQWHEELPDHLRLRFCNDKPATHLISDRSPILSLGYFYTRSLIHRPILCHASGSAAAAAAIVLAAAAKHIIQIVDLLDERCMNYTFPASKQDLLLNAGFSILWQCMDLEDDSNIIKDNQKSLTLLLAKIAKENTSVGSEFQKIACTIVAVGTPRTMQPRQLPTNSTATQIFGNAPASMPNKPKTPRKQLQAIASRISNMGTKDKPEIQPRRKIASSQPSPTATISANPFPRNISSLSLISTQSAPSMPPPTPSPRIQSHVRPAGPASSAVNLDYFPFEMPMQTCPTRSSSSTMLPPRKRSTLSVNEPETYHDNDIDAWEHVTPDFDPSTQEIYSTIEPTVLDKCISNPETGHIEWNADPWQLSGLYADKAHVPQSLLSFSEESLTSADDFVFSTASSSHHGSLSTASPDALAGGDESSGYKGIAMPISGIEDELDFSPTVRI